MLKKIILFLQLSFNKWSINYINLKKIYINTDILYIYTECLTVQDGLYQ